jgi:hypothetical protein
MKRDFWGSAKWVQVNSPTDTVQDNSPTHQDLYFRKTYFLCFVNVVFCYLSSVI